MFKLRFHLANGPHKYKWQIKDGEGNVSYVDPAHVNFTMTKCKLHNSPKVAQGIYAGKEKTVCSWIECENISIRHAYEEFPDEFFHNEVSYNPRVAPFWRNVAGENIDGKFFEVLETKGRKVFA